MPEPCPDGYQEICALKELKALKTIGFTYLKGEQELNAFIVYKKGEIYAYQNSCPHTGVTLNWQPNQFLSFDEEVIQCAMHGAQFRINDGFCQRGPCRGQSLVGIEVAICGEIVIICPSNKE